MSRTIYPVRREGLTGSRPSCWEPLPGFGVHGHPCPGEKEKAGVLPSVPLRLAPPPTKHRGCHIPL